MLCGPEAILLGLQQTWTRKAVWAAVGRRPLPSGLGASLHAGHPRLAELRLPFLEGWLTVQASQHSHHTGKSFLRPTYHLQKTSLNSPGL